MNASVVAYISSKDRYWTTLPSAMLCVIQQTVKPQKFILFMDGEHIDLRNNDLYLGLFKMLDYYNIIWQVVFGQGKGQVLNHQNAIYMANTEWLWRIDDDTFPQPNVLEGLLACNRPDVGAIAGLVIDTNNPIRKIPPDFKSTIDNLQLNRQWFLHNTTEPIETEHLYSTFIFKKEAAKHGYCQLLSPAGHREETIFTYEMYRNGWKLLVNPQVISWHVRQGQGGIRTHHNHPEYWDFDEKVFQMKLKEWGVKTEEKKLIVLDCGKGDHVLFKMILPEVKEKYKNCKIMIAATFPEILEDETGIQLLSIAEAANLQPNLDRYNIYRFCIDRHWKGTFLEAMREMYLNL
jgi:hypothetical protein